MKTKTDIKPEEFGNGHKNGKNSEPQLVTYLFNPTEDQLPGLTRIPLDQVNPCSFAKIYADELKELAKLAKKSQELYSANWDKWHSNDEVIDGRFKRIPPDPKYVEVKKVPYWKRLIWGKKHFMPKDDDDDKKEEPRKITIKENSLKSINTKKDSRFEILKGKTIVEKWLIFYYLHRRSTTPDMIMGGFELAGRQLEAKSPDNQDDWSEIIRKQ